VSSCVAAPFVPGPCSSSFMSNTRLTVAWPSTRGAFLFEIELNDSVSNERVYMATVRDNNFADIPLTKVELHSTYIFKITASGNDGQIGNTVSCIGVTGMYMCIYRSA